MIIPKALTVYDIEALLPEAIIDESLRLPLGSSYGGAFGVDTALTQLVITWAKYANSKTLHLYCNEEKWAPHVANLARTSAGLAALVMCSRIDTEKHIDVEKSDALSKLLPMIQAMYDGLLKNTSNSRGARPSAINLFSINHARREYIKPFYSMTPSPKVQPSSAFAEIINKASDLMHSKAHKQSLINSGLSELGDVVFELFSNADQHAAYDLHGEKYKKGLRGISIKSNKVKRSDLSDYAGEEPAFLRFILKNMTQGDTLELLEISVIDSGPGMAKKWLSYKEKRIIDDLSEVTIEKELSATIECFDKHITTKESDTSGMGLHRATQALNKLKAFVRLRTGRLCLYQTFNGKNDLVKFSPKPWSGDGVLSAVEGTAFTICIPVN
ncbi:ATP-binding protein [Pseudomonas yamanorum]|uniref:ATP-binding protein n=1 Tax=Pseudomonas yamanorum TaxID=515393 RepID=UPI003BA0C305